MDSLYLTALQNLTLLSSSCLSHCIVQLNAYYGLELNVHLDFSNSTSHLWLDRLANVTTLWLTSPELQLVLAGNYSERALTIVYLEDQQRVSLTLDYLTSWLWRLQHLQVLVIYPKATTYQLIQLFAYCWRQGLVHVLVLEPHTRQLFSYLPYPQLRLLRLSDPQQYYDRNQGQLQNFQGYVIHSAMLNLVAPRASIIRQLCSRDVPAGSMLRLLLDFIDHHNGSADISSVTIEEALARLASRTVDFLPYLLPPSSGSVTMGIVLYYGNWYVMAPMASPVPNRIMLMKPYTLSTWLTWLGMLAYSSLALFGLLRGRLSPSGAFLVIFRLALFLPDSLLTYMNRKIFVVYVIMTLAGFVLTNLYLALLSSMQTTGIYGQPLNSFDDLAGTNFTMPVYKLDYNSWHEMEDLHPLLKQRLVATPTEIMNRRQRQLDAKSLHYGYEDRIDYVLNQQKYLRITMLKKMPVTIKKQPVHMLVRFGQPFLPIFNSYMRRNFENGLLIKIKSDCFDQSGKIEFIGTRYLVVASNDVAYYYYVAILWTLGLLLAMISFLFERFEVLSSMI